MKQFLIFVIKIYKHFISPFLPQACRFTPTCSEYATEAIKEYGFFKGSYLSVLRILKCNPFGGFGYDPVKLKEKDKN